MDDVGFGEFAVAAEGVSASLFCCGKRGIENGLRMQERPGTDICILE